MKTVFQTMNIFKQFGQCMANFVFGTLAFILILYCWGNQHFNRVNLETVDAWGRVQSVVIYKQSDQNFSFRRIHQPGPALKSSLKLMKKLIQKFILKQ